MKKIVLIFSFFMLMGIAVNAQFKPFNASLGFNWNVTQRVPNQVPKAFFNDIAFSNQFNVFTTLNRVFSEYGVGFKGKRKNIYFDFSLLQGTDYLSASESDYVTTNDTSYFTSSNYDVSSALIGLRSAIRLSTPRDQRFVVHYSFGIEGLLAYDVDAEGQVWSRDSNFGASNETRTFIEPSFSGSYGNASLVQNIGLAFKFGKDETKFPFNKAYIESDFQLLNNFTFIDGTTSQYRTFGLILALGYQF
ncbi:MAG: hypothetical protein ACJA19_001823 [Bacteroidia bacterium]|jgi:hypothetical protein|tara:strand:- start:64 stop:807 length:744 start_codon:yes stop_codon:yes gene_type:complete